MGKHNNMSAKKSNLIGNSNQSSIEICYNYRQIVEFVPSPAIIISTDGIIKSVNFELEQIIGRDKSELVNHCFSCYINDNSSNFIRSILRQKQFKKIKVTLSCVNEVSKNVLLNGKLISPTEFLIELKEVANAPVDHINNYQQLLDKFRQTAEELTIARTLYENSEQCQIQLFEHISNGVAIYQPIDNGTDFRFLDFNKAAEKITNTSRCDIIGHTLLEKFPKMSTNLFFRALKEVNETSNSKHVIPFYYIDNVYSGWYENSIYKLPSGEIVSIFSDVTEKMKYVNQIRRQNKKLKMSMKKAQENERLKTAFLQNLSHEIRTPLNAICGFSMLLRFPDLPQEKQNEFIDIINVSSNRLVTVITDLLTLSSLETGVEKVYDSLFNINDLVLDVVEEQTVNLYEQDIYLYHSCGFEVEKAKIKSDKSKIRRILNCLVDNAIKFTSEGKISVGYVVKDNFLEFKVTDTGVGIHSDFHEKIFERFQQADDTIHTHYGGNGLGLTIAKAYVELLGGKIWLVSKPGSGTTVSFAVPYVSGNYAVENPFNNAVNDRISFLG
ncbi:MAG: ATP-binding protein [Salinivirgaceae bacterium]|nr:ATP-binding protein [Salinivirgaceae bacterium]MDD4746779.1 ATP-binding protein [Salinivirgaceae bacterium]